MSQVTDLKAQLAQIASESKTAGGSLSQFQNRFSGHIAKVESLISGTSTKADVEIAGVLEEARRAAEQASAALLAAADRCEKFAQQV
ncbi:hypothetical protein ACFS27_22845 [Promicromonospora vindobonensis]|uniref:Uncharacterized protein n=1 Tax=Promicromonospora vindobonensis TaxID=195748 RepID=A0ABW5VZS0_9MICO